MPAHPRFTRSAVARASASRCGAARRAAPAAKRAAFGRTGHAALRPAPVQPTLPGQRKCVSKPLVNGFIWPFVLSSRAACRPSKSKSSINRLADVVPVNRPRSISRNSAQGPVVAIVDVSGRIRGFAVISAIAPPRGPGQFTENGSTGPWT